MIIVAVVVAHVRAGVAVAFDAVRRLGPMRSLKMCWMMLMTIPMRLTTPRRLMTLLPALTLHSRCLPAAVVVDDVVASTGLH